MLLKNGVTLLKVIFNLNRPRMEFFSCLVC